MHWNKPDRVFRLLCLFGCLLCGCSIARNVRPVGAGKAAVGISLGGPIFSNLGPPLPTPLIGIFGRYGLSERTDLDLGLHMPIARAVGLDFGAAHLFVLQQGAWPAVMAGARLALFGNGSTLLGRIDPDTQKVYSLKPQLFEEIYGTASWQINRWLAYSGLDIFAQAEQRTIRPSLYTGAQWRAFDSLGLSAELKWMAFLTNQSSLAVNWRGLGGYGAWAVQVGATYYFASGGPL